MSSAARRISAPNLRLFQAPVLSVATGITVLTNAAIMPAMFAAYPMLRREAELPEQSLYGGVAQFLAGGVLQEATPFGDAVAAGRSLRSSSGSFCMVWSVLGSLPPPFLGASGAPRSGRS